MQNHFLFLSWSVLGPFIAFIFCFSLFLFFSSKKKSKDTRLIDVFTNILIIIGAIAWVVITSK
ncbi:hypothetical protein [Fictibacillus barbaricus]|uniref:Uncharacterized protein n=1 Tax=Fictibacillus barbaricus TaxID=182136 RepID=A0ABU1U3S5_9BACL|nr:hypothetical protein [Fictibacillus barbaricus]MDR7074123.1 hypothetical protein [Fictibacillus barbaricus]